MQTLPAALASLGYFNQFVLYKLIPTEIPGKFSKIPVNPRTRAPFVKGSNWQRDPSQMSDFATAAANVIPGYGVGFLFTPEDPFFFVDIDDCLNPDGVTWSPLALDVCALFPGAAMEISSSGRGLHIFGMGTTPRQFANKNSALGLEFYTEWRFVALTGNGAMGSIDTCHGLDPVIDKYFQAGAKVDLADWSSEPVAEWAGPEDDDALIEKFLSVKSAAEVFGGVSNIRALWDGDEDALGKLYEDKFSGRPFDASAADAGLAQHLAFWTGNNCDRILTLMKRSGLVRDKWEREDYLERTIIQAVSKQTNFFHEIDVRIADKFGAGRIDASSDAQRDFAERIRAQVVAKSTEAQASMLCQSQTSAKFWLDNQDKTPDELVAMIAPVKTSTSKTTNTEPEIVTGYQHIGATLMMEKFKGCVYVCDQHRILTPSGAMLKPEQFNAVHGGYVFQLDAANDKTTRKAWEAFTESQCVRFPKVDSMFFDPRLPSLSFVEKEGITAVNTYVPIETPRVKGDLTPFLTHVEKLLPNERDREILISYMAACVQYKGVKFQWCPLIQGAPGNGKTLLTRCVKFAVGDRYSHMPKAKELTSKFNSWLVGKLFIGVEDIYVPESKKEVLEDLKPMITAGDGYEIEGKGVDQYNSNLSCNFILNSNHKDAIRKTEDDRRFAVFYTRQQTALDLVRDGMDGDYFPNLYTWLDNVGYAIVNEYLQTYQIKDEFNPATKCIRAPSTSSTVEALDVGQGSIEQEVKEAIASGRPGFLKGWVSSIALDQLLKELRAERIIPTNKRPELMATLGYIKHPKLPDGRCTMAMACDEFRKPRLYVIPGSIQSNIETPAEVMKTYHNAQTSGVEATGKAQEIFK